MEVVVTAGAAGRAELQYNHYHQQTDAKSFYRPGALPVAQPTVSKHWRERKVYYYYYYYYFIFILRRYNPEGV